MSIVTIILQCPFTADLLEHGTTLVAATQPDKVDFPKEIINKGTVAEDSRGIAISTTRDNEVHCFVWLKSKPVFFVHTLYLAAPHILQLLGVYWMKHGFRLHVQRLIINTWVV